MTREEWLAAMHLYVGRPWYPHEEKDWDRYCQDRFEYMIVMIRITDGLPMARAVAGMMCHGSWDALEDDETYIAELMPGDDWLNEPSYRSFCSGGGE